MLLHRRHLLIGSAAATLLPSLARADEARVPFDYSDGKIRIPVRVNGIEISTVLDSGAAYNAMDAKLARDFKIASNSRVDLKTIGGATHGPISDEIDLTVAGKAVPRSVFAVLDLSKVAAPGGQPVDLILGAPLFRRFVVDFDFVGRTMALYSSADYPLPDPGQALALAAADKLMTVQVFLPGGSVQATVDTGSDAPLILSPAAAARLNILKHGPVSTTLMAGLGGTSVGQITTVPQVGFGGQNFDNVPVQVAARDFGTEANIGCGLLNRFRTAADFDGGWLIVSPGGLETPFRKNLTGLSAAREAEGLRVRHVARSSPAQAAGFHEGDLIVAIDGAPALTATVQLADLPAGRSAAFTLKGGKIRTLTLAAYY